MGIDVEVSEATSRQLQLESLRVLNSLVTTALDLQIAISKLRPGGVQVRYDARFDTLERMMTELSDAVTTLQGAVDGVSQRLLPQLLTLEAANATLQTQLTGAQADDAAAAAALVDAQTATAAIRVEIDRLNALGTSPATPVDPNPPVVVDPPVVQVPADPNPPADPPASPFA